MEEASEGEKEKKEKTGSKQQSKTVKSRRSVGD